MSSDANPKLPTRSISTAVRAKLAQEDGKRFWQSLEELAETPEFHDFLVNEFPRRPMKPGSEIGRRDVLKFACGVRGAGGTERLHQAAHRKIVPYVKPPEEIIPGRPLFYATSMPLAGIAQRAAGGKPHGPADKDRRQSRNIRAAWVGRTYFHAGFTLEPVRSGPFAR